MKRSVCFALILFALAFAAIAQQQSVCSASVPTVDGAGVAGVMLDDLEHGMVYVVYSKTILPISAVDCSVGNQITLPWPAAMVYTGGALAITACIDPLTGTIGTAGGTGASVVQIIDPVSGQVKSFQTPDFDTACAFGNGLLYTESGENDNYVYEWTTIRSYNETTGTLVNSWSQVGIGMPFALAVSASGKVYFIDKFVTQDCAFATAKCQTELDVLNPGGTFTTLSQWTGPAGTSIMAIGPNGYVYVAQMVFDQNGQQIGGAGFGLSTAASFPSSDPWYIYKVYQGFFGGVNAATDTEAINLSTTGQTYFGVAAERQPDGTDLVIALRSGYLDFFKVTPPMLMHFVANAGIFESPSFVPSSLASVAVAPGSLITIYGQGLGSIGEYDVADTTKIVTQLGNTQVYLDGHIAKTVQLLFVGYNQVNASLPRNLSNGTHTISVKNGSMTASQNFTIVDQSLASFMWSPDPTNPTATIPILTNQQYQLVGPATSPVAAQANANDVLTFWATGGGRTNPPLDDSIAVTPLSPLYYLASPPQVLVDGHAAIVTYAGLAPGETPGLNQINFVVPAGLTPGAHDLTLGSVIYKGALWIK